MLNNILKYLKRLHYRRIIGDINYDINYKLDVLLIYLEKIGIDKVSYTKNNYYIIIDFKDGTRFRGYNENRWYAWLSIGEINFSNNKQLSWNNSMPSEEVIYKFRKAILKIEKPSNSSNVNFDEYLPAKLLRKKKLEKLSKIK
jgi:hypothetical protein